MNLLEILRSGPSLFLGVGTNHEGESFSGRLEIQPLVNATALMLHYTATRNDGKHLHQESTLLASAPDGVLCLWPVMEELPFVLPHRAINQTDKALAGDDMLAIVFASGPRDMTSVFREEITIAVKSSGELHIAHSWGMPGGGFAQRSHCTLRAANT